MLRSSRVVLAVCTFIIGLAVVMVTNYFTLAPPVDVLPEAKAAKQIEKWAQKKDRLDKRINKGANVVRDRK